MYTSPQIFRLESLKSLEFRNLKLKRIGMVTGKIFVPIIDTTVCSVCFMEVNNDHSIYKCTQRHTQYSDKEVLN